MKWSLVLTSLKWVRTRLRWENSLSHVQKFHQSKSKNTKEGIDNLSLSQTEQNRSTHRQNTHKPIAPFLQAVYTDQSVPQVGQLRQPAPVMSKIHTDSRDLVSSSWKTYESIAATARMTQTICFWQMRDEQRFRLLRLFAPAMREMHTESSDFASPSWTKVLATLLTHARIRIGEAGPSSKPHLNYYGDFISSCWNQSLKGWKAFLVFIWLHIRSPSLPDACKDEPNRKQKTKKLERGNIDKENWGTLLEPSLLKLNTLPWVSHKRRVAWPIHQMWGQIWTSSRDFWIRLMEEVIHVKERGD